MWVPESMCALICMECTVPAGRWQRSAGCGSVHEVWRVFECFVCVLVYVYDSMCVRVPAVCGVMLVPLCVTVCWRAGCRSRRGLRFDRETTKKKPWSVRVATGASLSPGARVKGRRVPSLVRTCRSEKLGRGSSQPTRSEV